MLNLHIITVGRDKDKWVTGQIEHFRKLIGKYAQLEITTVPEEKYGKGVNIKKILSLEAEKIKAKLDKSDTFKDPIVTEITAAGPFYKAEEYHQQYYKKIICADKRLLGAAFLDTDIDAGVIQYLIRKKIDIGPYKEMLLQTPREVACWLMNEAERKETISKEE